LKRYNKVYSKLKQFVTAVLSDNKILLSTPFVALPHTLKADPQLVRLIQNMTTANDGEHNKDNNNNIIKYFEFNMDSLLDLAKKNYENLVEVLTNSNITMLHMLLLIPVFAAEVVIYIPNLSNQNDTYRLEESE
jgi:hypothetical protein